MHNTKDDTTLINICREKIVCTILCIIIPENDFSQGQITVMIFHEIATVS